MWNAWTDPDTSENVESYTKPTVNADSHPLMSRMHRPDPKLPSDRQDKRSVVAIELANVPTWLTGSIGDTSQLVKPPALEFIEVKTME